ncbi:hypothetical protein HO173_001442 [Letharia columbiana]|uniref:Uncharacterized protein n=1 Tax=Letharia columbiana TaxID=112416 RepID=A0A8H6G548_9LECA|nr:uncharacterized protein HO173_001442 [Letharia columbiana]KAF6240769.1 hypothetical protein HO173_001442 [Letharia columbiana]
MTISPYKIAQMGTKKRETASLPREQHRCNSPWRESSVNILNMPLSLTRMPETSSTSQSQPAPAVSADPSTQQWMEVLEKGKPPRERSRKLGKPLEIMIAGAIATARELGLENSPSRWQSGHHGWFFGKKYIEGKSFQTQRMKMVEVRNWPVKISTLPSEGQISVYLTLLKTARVDQVAAYYRLHCEQIDKVRCCIARELIEHRENDKQYRQIFPVLFARHGHIAKLSKLKKAAHAVQVANKQYRLRAGTRAYARGLEMLIEKCEARLQRIENFRAADWRSYGKRPRWADGRRGWTGLRPEEVDVRTVDTTKDEEVCSRDMRTEKLQGVLRARYARSFPQAADRKLATSAIEDRRDREIVWAERIEKAKAILRKAFR